MDGNRPRFWLRCIFNAIENSTKISVYKSNTLILMKIYFWNLNNKAEAISAIQRNSEYFENSLFAFSEFWDLTGELDVLSERFNVWHDSIHKRTGIFYGRRFQVNPESGQPYFSSYSFEYNEIFVSLYVVHLKSRMRSESTSERFAAEIRREIGEKIAAKQTEFVIIIGDFNLPYFHEHFLNLFVFNTTSYFSKKDAKHKTIEGFVNSGCEKTFGTQIDRKGEKTRISRIFDNSFQRGR